MRAGAKEAANEAGQRIQVLDRGAMLLRAIAEEPQPLSALELATVCGLNRTTAWRILVSLEQNGLVERDPMTQRYRLGYSLWELAVKADQGSLIRIARPILERVAATASEQVTLGVPHHFGWTYVDHVQPPAADVPRWLGRSGPLHATGSGKLLLAVLPAAERKALLPSRLERFTEHTIVSRPALEAELERIREDGFAVSFAEHDELSSAVCAGVLDDRGRPLALVDVWGPSQRLTPQRLRQLGPQLRAAADELGEKMA